ILVLGSFYTVAETERVILTTWGKFDSVVGPGLHWKVPIAQAVRAYPVTIQSVSTDDSAGGLNSYTVDRQDAWVRVFYRINPDKVEFVYKNTPDFETKVYNLAVDRLKREMGKINTNELAAQRGAIAGQIRSVLEEVSMNTLGLEI